MTSSCSIINSFLLLLLSITAVLTSDVKPSCEPGSTACPQGRMCEDRACIADPRAGPCYKKRQEALEELSDLVHLNCTHDGFYAPQQCIDSDCTCVGRDGEHLVEFESVPICRAHMQTCRCAQDWKEFQKRGRIGRVFSCDAVGNYINFQCSGTSCFCVDAFGKIEVTKPPVHISRLHDLQC